jgi:hypothetical protein
MSSVTVEGKGGRPRLGDEDDRLIYRPVGFLKSQWDWLKEQPHGAAAALRKMVERAMRRSRHASRRK